MTEISERYRQRSQEFADTVAAVPEDRWSNQSPCDEWTARDVVRHVVQTPGIFFGMIGAEYPEAPSVDDDPDAAVAFARGDAAPRSTIRTPRPLSSTDSSGARRSSRPSTGS